MNPKLLLVLFFGVIGIFLTNFWGCSPSEYEVADGIRFHKSNPLVGICIQEGQITIQHKEKGIALQIDLKNQRFIRESETSPWKLDPAGLPKELNIFTQEECTITIKPEKP